MVQIQGLSDHKGKRKYGHANKTDKLIWHTFYIIFVVLLLYCYIILMCAKKIIIITMDDGWECLLSLYILGMKEIIAITTFNAFSREGKVVQGDLAQGEIEMCT